MLPRVAVIILTYNGIDDTLACLASLAAQDYPAERRALIVVDNASSDTTLERVRALYPWVTLIANGANLGFAAGNNVGLRYALEHGFDYALLLNNDTEGPVDFLRNLVCAAAADPTIGAAGPLITYHERPELIWSAGGMIDWRRGTSSMRGIGEVAPKQVEPPVDVDFVTGCAILVSREAMARAGILDERFFMYYEETEWCVRIARAGLRITYVPAARLLHKIPLADRVDRPYVAYYMTRNRLLFLGAVRASLRAWFHAVILQDGRTLFSYSLRPKWRNRRAQRDAMIQGWADFLRGRFGRRDVRLS